MSKDKAVFIAGGIAVLAQIVNGWILTLLWGWFVVPVFHAPEIGLVPAIGILLLLEFVAPPVQEKTFSDDEEANLELLAHMLTVAFVKADYALVVGFIVVQFMPR